MNNAEVQQNNIKVQRRRSHKKSMPDELDALDAMSDADIDTSDIPETMEFPNPRRGVFSAFPNRRVCSDNGSSNMILEGKS